ncbi:MtN3-like protein [Phytophthora cinnamomi]|uniref:MtN3-like protein n=1 Tax=Phytophthora cinnamomi TaxID=4785 RepID=UPI00355A527C|nr:MtN3-like protein [Phytophthora cinnamomi]
MLSSPSLNIYRVYKAKSVGVQSIFPLVALLANSHLWMMYGYMAKIYFPVFSCFLVGDFAALIYLTIYFHYSNSRSYVIRSITAVLTVLTILSLYAIAGGLGHTRQSRHEVSTVLGFFADIASVCLYCAPIERLFMVLKHKSAVFINLPMVLAGYANNTIWLTFGSLIQNYFMISINIFFFTMNSITLVVYQIYNPKTHPLKDGWDAISSKSSKVDDFHIQVAVDVSEDLKTTDMKSDKILLGPPIPHYEINRSRVVPAIAD